MKKAIFLMVLLVLASSAFAQFRGIDWGVTIDEVKQSETAELLAEDPEYLVYSDTIGGLSAHVYYLFHNGKFFRGTYSFNERHSQKNMFIDDYYKINSLLKEKYGEPKAEKIMWLNDLYRDDKDEYGFAVSLGHLKYYSDWETDDITIRNILAGDNYEINHLIFYEYKPLSEQQSEARKEEAKDKL